MAILQQCSIALQLNLTVPAKDLKSLHRCLDGLKGHHSQISNYLENKEHLSKAVIVSWQKMLKVYEEEIKHIENAIDSLLDSNNELKLCAQNLQTIPGIGKTTAVAILAESPNFSIFKNARQYAVYAGLVPKHRISGSSVRGKARLSKLGSSKLRKAMYFPAIVAKNHNPAFKAFYEKMKSKDKHNMVIIAKPA